MNPNALLTSVLLGSVGLGFFVYGKKQRRGPHLTVGVLLMAYPYFVSSVPVMLGIAAGLVGLLYLVTYLGL